MLIRPKPWRNNDQKVVVERRYRQLRCLLEESNALALAISTREDSNKIAALVAAVAAVVAIVVTITGGLDSTTLETMALISGITYLVHMVWFFMLGLNLSKVE